ncbi:MULTISPECIES: Kiwa anti-phage protein KwaB-like domain-containing protein [Photorhabdus]|uniref:DUF4868 domain-containing protein n=2 Tax=Photorhabdus TaxID=29487 RepID=A0ABX0B026_9GAMM|nr:MULTISPECIES: Kiwa anti-phage protein KwaB-like domain-containing protein [Photorhabdus]MCC8375496.1 DUF4868 domain-containing protein [Photorhabdus bodei]MCC8465621.1 DUF4868 domain-containing protein [Photorhabdus bodei]MCT8354636.1 DUF4868 domain-containing protein [Photorhabdus kayaii]MDB6375257.1 DUF4868 domain-containing protein [Photorhabdus bodei]NDL10234.1 DUF4868 domain-containing protein [Photorhabdus kayaii]
MELFAITDSIIPNRIIKIDLDQSAQERMEDLFTEAKNSFISENDEEISFSVSYNLSPDEFFSIPEFTDDIGIIDAIERPDSVHIWNPEEISVFYFKALFTGIPSNEKKEAEVFFQVFDKRQVINNEKAFLQMLTQPKNRFSVSTRPGFSISDKLNAMLIGDKLIFKSFYMVRRFLDMDGYFTEATREDLESFTQHDIFHMEDTASFMELADSSIKKKVSLISNSGILDTDIDRLQTCAEMINYDLNITVISNTRKIVIPREKKEIKKLLNFLDQGYFNTIITNEPMFTNSKRPSQL